jgi:hypothetical protein
VTGPILVSILAGRQEIQFTKDEKMSRFRKLLIENTMSRGFKVARVVLPILTVAALTVVVRTHAQDRHEPFKFNLVPASATVIWWADPVADVCFGPGGGPVTPFDGDNEAGATIVSSKNFLPGAPLP